MHVNLKLQTSVIGGGCMYSGMCMQRVTSASWDCDAAGIFAWLSSLPSDYFAPTYTFLFPRCRIHADSYLVNHNLITSGRSKQPSNQPACTARKALRRRYESLHALQRVVNFEGYYLDGEEASSVPREPVYQSHKLDSLEAESKYTDNRTMVRLTGRYHIKSAPRLVPQVSEIVCMPF
jgi:hypothetical protein